MTMLGESQHLHLGAVWCVECVAEISRLRRVVVGYQYRDHLASGTCTGGANMSVEHGYRSWPCATCELFKAQLPALAVTQFENPE